MIKENDMPHQLSGKKYWKSLDSLSESPAFQEWVGKEFPEGAQLLDEVGRRSFIKVMAASFGLAGLGMTGCRRPEHTILPYGKSPEELIPGVPNFYATAQPTSAGFAPVIAESHQGRPTKIEGNPSFIPSGGSTDIYSQASVLDLYDPDRTQSSLLKEEITKGNKKSTSWKKISSFEATEKLVGFSKLDKVAILSDSSHSLVRNRILQKLTSQGVKHIEFESIDLQKPEFGLANSLSLPKGLRCIPKLQNAKKVLSLDCDFLGTREPVSTTNSRQFMSGRKVLSPSDAAKMNRLYIAESDLTITGGVADHRLRVHSSEVEAFSCLVYAEILKLLKSKDTELIAHLEKLGSSVAQHAEWVAECAKDLISNKKNSVVLAGSHQTENAHLVTYAINQSLGSVGTCVNYVSTKSPSNYTFENLSEDVKSGSIETVVVIGGNPVFTCPSSGIASILKEAKNSVRIAPCLDETSDHCQLHIGQSHYLESWDLGTTWDLSAVVPVQPLIAPLFDTLSDVEVLSILAGEKSNSYDLVVSEYDQLKGKKNSFEDFLKYGVHRIPRKWKNEPLNFKSSLLEQKPKEFSFSLDSLEVVVIPDFHTWDGKYGNNGWMLECPDPISKLTWDNAILISPVLAKELESKYPEFKLLPKSTMLNDSGQIAPDAAVFDGGKQKAPVLTVKIDDHHSLTGPLYVQPGLSDYTLIASLGMGRTHVGRVGTDLGYEASSLLHSHGNRIFSGATCKPTGDFRILANVQEHWSMEGRAIVREANVSKYKKDPSFALHMGAESHSPPIYGKDLDKDLAFKAQTTPRGNSSYDHPDHNYEKSDIPGLHQWGMTIDLNQCTGCSACVVACQSENNIPVVGKDQVLRGREMHWIRLDRYFSSTNREGAELPSDVQVSFQGVACMHCETAPCESVCPVNATVHDEEGLNAMAYNRCVGTRYCANNCPYKVRRFNFFDWNKRSTDELYQGPLGTKNDSLPTMGKNPDVTVRMRGVMEKCTYCTQRIQETKIKTKVNAQRKATLETGMDGKDLVLELDDVKVPDGSIKTACQQVCPTDAIVFGDISDPESEVSKLKNNPRDYSVLGYLNTRPRTTFLAKVRNPNPRMPDHSSYPHSYREYKDKAYPSNHDDGNSKGLKH